jgi:hypothetical protein
VAGPGAVGWRAAVASAPAGLPRAVADVRSEGCSWAEIGDLLGVTRAAPGTATAGQTGQGIPAQLADPPSQHRKPAAPNGKDPNTRST